jgi:hypothetical protein
LGHACHAVTERTRAAQVQKPSNSVRGKNAHPDQARQSRRTHLRRAFHNVALR